MDASCADLLSPSFFFFFFSLSTESSAFYRSSSFFSFSLFETGGRPSLRSIVILRPCDSGLLLTQDLKDKIKEIIFSFFGEGLEELDSIPAKSENLQTVCIILRIK